MNVTPLESCHLSGAGATRVTLNLPAAAVDKLSRLAEAGGGEAELLRDLGILSLKVEGGQVQDYIILALWTIKKILVLDHFYDHGW